MGSPGISATTRSIPIAFRKACSCSRSCFRRKEEAQSFQCGLNIDPSGDAQLRERASQALPPVSVDCPSRNCAYGPLPNNSPYPHQNWSQHARLLPYLEEGSLDNAINWNFGARGNDGDAVYTDHNPPDDANGGPDSMPQMTVLVTTITAFLCPSDGNPGSSGRFVVGGERMLVGASNYPCNIGLNRRTLAGGLMRAGS